MNDWDFRPHQCTYRLDWTRRNPRAWRNGEINERTLPSRHMIRDSSPGHFQHCYNVPFRERKHIGNE